MHIYLTFGKYRKACRRQKKNNKRSCIISPPGDNLYYHFGFHLPRLYSAFLSIHFRVCCVVIKLELYYIDVLFKFLVFMTPVKRMMLPSSVSLSQTWLIFVFITKVLHFEEQSSWWAKLTESQFSHWLAAWPWTRYSATVCRSLRIRKTGIQMEYPL